MNLKQTKIMIRDRMRTTEDLLLVRENADVLPKRLSEGYGHLVCFAVLNTDREEKDR